MKKRISLLSLCFTFCFIFIVQSGCDITGPGLGNNGLSTRIDRREVSRLTSFSQSVLDQYGSLEDLADDLDSLALTYSEAMIESDNFPHFYYFFYEFAAMDDAAANSAGNDYSTNNQVSGVEEVDTVQSNGEILFTAAGGDLFSINADGEIIDQISIFEENAIAGMLLYGNRLLVIEEQRYYGWFCDVYGGTDMSSQLTGVALVNINGSGELSLGTKETLRGNFHDARMIDGQIYLSTVQDLSLYDLLVDVCDRLPDVETVSRSRLKELAYEELDTAIPRWRNKLISNLFGEGNDLDLDAVLNTVRLFELADGAGEDDILPFYDSFNSYFNLYSFHMDNSFNDLDRSGSFSTGSSWSSTMYSNGEYTIIANDGWKTSNNSWQEQVYLLAYENRNGNPEPISIGKTNGHTLNQFSLDIHDNHLRIATTQWARWSRENGQWSMEAPSESFVSVLTIESIDSEMDRVGYLDGLGLGERLFATRFLGDRGFLVTFEQVDPFYTLDLSDAHNPSVVGELVIPGFSRYLHPMDENHILAIGQDNGLQVAVFDVTNMASPTQEHKYQFPGYSGSNAEWDHHGFRYIPERELLILPQWSYDWDSGSSRGFSLMNVSLSSGISERAYIDYTDQYDYNGLWIRNPRSLILNDVLITMRDQRIRGNSLSDHAQLWEIDL